MDNLNDKIENIGINNDIDSEKKEIVIEKGDVKDLNISPVYDHIEIEKPKDSNPAKKGIIIPEEKK